MLSQRLKTRLLHLQSTPFCNLNCKYCYLPGRDTQAEMASEIPVLALEFLSNAGCLDEELVIGWHLGEPLVLPVSYYENVFDTIKLARIDKLKIKYHFQTNATLITDEFCRLFKERNVAVGVSLDGPEHLHDSNRRTRRGDGSYRSVMQGIERLQAHGIRFSVITVLTRTTLEEPEQLFNFYIANRIERVCFNFEEVEGVNKTSSLSIKDAFAVRQFLSRYIELLGSNRVKHWVREIDGGLRFLFDKNVKDDAQNRPLGIVSVNWKGDVSTFSPELLGMKHDRFGDFIIGNVLENSIDDILRNEKFLQINSEIQEGLKECRQTCGYFSVCGGGSPSNKLAENQTFASTETMNCRLSVKVVTDVLLDLVEEKSSGVFSNEETRSLLSGG